MQRRVAVVGVGDALQVGDVGCAEEAGLGAPARGREVGRLRDLAAVGDDLALGQSRRPVGARALGADAAVVLRARVGVEVEGLATDVGGERDRASGDGERLQRLQRPFRRHLDGHRAAHVVVDGERVDDVERAGAGGHGLQRAAVGAETLDLDHAGAVGVQTGAAAGEQLAGAGQQSDRGAPRVRPIGKTALEPLPAGRGRVGEGDVGGADVEQDPYQRRPLQPGDLHVAEVVMEDRPVTRPMEAVAVSAVGAQPHPVPEAAAAHDPGHGSLLGGWGRNRCDGEGEEAHGE